MKRMFLHPWSLSLLAAAALAGVLTDARAQSVNTSITNTFDATTTTSGWTYWYDIYSPPFGAGYNVTILNWASTPDNSPGHPGSGSLVYSNIWPGIASGQYTNGNYYGQNQIWGTFASSGGNQYDFSKSIDGTKYDSVSFDIRALPGCPTNSDGNICQLTVGFFTGNFQVHGTTNVNIPLSATSSWYHVVALINKSDVGAITNSVGWAININCYGGPNRILFTNTTPTTLYIDNIQANRSKTVTPPPIMSTVIQDPVAGMNFLSSRTSGDQYQRSSLKLSSTFGSGWLGQSNVTYSFTITNFPNPLVYTGYQAHLFIATGPGTAAALDYNETNLIWFNVSGTANGTASGAFRYKIFEQGANSNLFGAEYTVGPLGTPWAGTLTNFAAPTVLGTWSMTFNQDTNVTLRGPGGAIASFSIRPEVAAQFADPLNICFGAQPNQPNDPTGTNLVLRDFNRGQKVVFASASITNEGTASSIVSDDFISDSSLNTGLWTPLANVPGTPQLFPLDPGSKLVKWSVPDSFFGLQTATNINGPWSVLSGIEAGSPVYSFTLDGSMNALVPSLALGPKQDYFRVFTRRFTKLQILMPGETAAPGTLTGKTGTPEPQIINVPFSVVVNSVSPDWYPAPYASDHTIHLASSDGSATLPADVDLSNGTLTLNVTFNASGSFTVTASDVTDPTKTASTSPPITVP